MPTYSSPGNYVIEKDFSNYAPAVNSSVAGIVGYGSKGPANKPTLITSPSQLIKTFGSTDSIDGGQGLLGAVEILSKTNSIYYVRAEDATTALDASAVVEFGSCPAVEVSGLAGASITFTFSSTDQAGASNTPTADGYELVVAAADGANVTTLDVMTAQAGVQTHAWPWSAVSGADSTRIQFVNTHAGKDAKLTVSSTISNGVGSFQHTGDVISVGANALTASALTANKLSAGGCYFVESLYTGTSYNASTVTTALGVVNKGNKVVVESKAGKDFTLTVTDEGVTAESYPLTMEKDGLFPETKINIGEVNPTSEFIKASFQDSTGTLDNTWATTLFADKVSGGLSATDSAGLAYSAVTPRFLKFIDGTYELTGGKNGDLEGSASITGTPKSAIVGSAATKTGIHALDDDALNISMACVPGITEQSIQNELVTLAETSQNFLAVIAPPEGLSTAQKAINWHNGQYTGRTAAVNSSYAAIYWPWLKTYDAQTSTDIFIDPATYAVSIMCHTDAVSDPWFAPAGLTRGRLTKPTDVEVVLNQGDRDSMYQPGNAVNPIAKFAQDGIVIWGQRTAQRTPSALDRINVRRMMIVIRKMVLAATRVIVFEPNDPLTWNRVVNLLQPALDDIRRRRGITEFKVICDGTTNTALRIDRNELWCRVMIKPTKTAEVLVFELNLTNQSASI